MKKILALLLALIMATCLLTACGAPKEDASTGSDAADNAPPTGEQKKTILVMGTNAAFKPYEYVDESGKIVGIDAEIAEAIAAKMGMTLKIEDMDFDSIMLSAQKEKSVHIFKNRRQLNRYLRSL